MFTNGMIAIKSKDANLPSNEETSSHGVEVNLKGKKRVAKQVANEAMAAPAKKKKKTNARKVVVADDAANKANTCGLADPRVQPEPSEDSEAGKVSQTAESHFRANTLITHTDL